MSDFKKMMKALDEWVKGVPTADQVRARFIDYETEVSHCAGWIDGVSDEYGTAFDQWLNEVQAEAWEEGYEAAAMRVPEGVWHDTASPRTPNPYRKDKTDD